jgi:hypothetical protein
LDPTGDGRYGYKPRLIIQRAFEWRDDHLYSFFMSGRRRDTESEIGSPWSDTSHHTHQVEIGRLGLKVGGRFLYYFDYGDSHEFDVKVVSITTSAPRAAYPRIVARRGQSPAQYQGYPQDGGSRDEETGESSGWNPYRRG